MSLKDLKNCQIWRENFFQRWKFSWRTKNIVVNILILTSGVSAGQIIPQWVLCNCRGRANLPSLPMGEFSRRKWESVDANVNRFNTWDTPALAWWAFFWSPQFPVANEYLNPSVIVFVLIAKSILKSFPLSINFWAYNRTSFIRFLNNLN